MPSHSQPPPSEPREFGKLLAAAKSGDPTALNGLCRRLYPRVELIVHANLRSNIPNGHRWFASRFSTGDMVQEVFRSALESLPEFEGDHEQDLVSFLAALSRNRILDAIRFHGAIRRDVRRSHADLEGTEDLPAPGEGPGTKAAQIDELRAYEKALSKLTECERTLLRLRVEEGWTFAQLAASLAYPSPTSARRAYFVAQARLALRLRSQFRPPTDPDDGALE